MICASTHQELARTSYGLRNFRTPWIKILAVLLYIDRFSDCRKLPSTKSIPPLYTNIISELFLALSRHPRSLQRMVSFAVLCDGKAKMKQKFPGAMCGCFHAQSHIHTTRTNHTSADNIAMHCTSCVSIESHHYTRKCRTRDRPARRRYHS